jgi:hypothetical protein
MKWQQSYTCCDFWTILQPPVMGQSKYLQCNLINLWSENKAANTWGNQVGCYLNLISLIKLHNIYSIRNGHYWRICTIRTCTKFVVNLATYINENVFDEKSFSLQKWNWPVIPCLLFHLQLYFERTNYAYNKHETRLFEEPEMVSMTTSCLYRKERDKIDRFRVVSTYAMSTQFWVGNVDRERLTFAVVDLFCNFACTV